MSRDIVSWAVSVIVVAAVSLITIIEQLNLV